MDTIGTGVTTKETCLTCRRGVEAFRIALKSFDKRYLLTMVKLSCYRMAGVLETVPEVCIGLLNGYIDSVSLQKDAQSRYNRTTRFFNYKFNSSFN